jgi:hypothetical protein
MSLVLRIAESASPRANIHKTLMQLHNFTNTHKKCALLKLSRQNKHTSRAVHKYLLQRFQNVGALWLMINVRRALKFC